jgi:hypothetical protein
MRRHGIQVLAALGVIVWLTGCSSPAPAPAASVTPGTPANVVDIQLTGADIAHLVSPIAVPCSGGVGNEGQPLLGVGLDAARTASGTAVALNLTIVGFKSKGTYDAAAVWAADGATAVTLDPNPSEPVSEERFIAKSGSVTVTSVQGAEFAGLIDATLVPESPTTRPTQVEVSGHWSCLE